MTRKQTTPNALRQIEECMTKQSFDVNDDGQLVMTHPEKFTRSEVEMLKLWFAKHAEALRQNARNKGFKA
jgi:hypothetical protein